MFYVSEQNLQKRAYKMEETFKKLDKLNNKIGITLYKEKLEESKSSSKEFDENFHKKLYREYEAIIASIENHDPIDYYMYKVNTYKNIDTKVGYEELREAMNEIKKFKRWEMIKRTLRYGVPATLGGMVLVILISI